MQAAHTGPPPQPPFQSLDTPAGKQKQQIESASEVTSPGAPDAAGTVPDPVNASPTGPPDFGAVGVQSRGAAPDESTPIAPASAGTPFTAQQPQAKPVTGPATSQEATFSSYDSPVSSALGIPSTSGALPGSSSLRPGQSTASGIVSVDLAAGLRAGGSDTRHLDMMPTPSLGAPSSMGDNASTVELAPQQPRSATPADAAGGDGIAAAEQPATAYSNKSTAGSTVPLSIDTSDTTADDGDVGDVLDVQSAVSEPGRSSRPSETVTDTAQWPRGSAPAPARPQSSAREVQRNVGQNCAAQQEGRAPGAEQPSTAGTQLSQTNIAATSGAEMLLVHDGRAFPAAPNVGGTSASATTTPLRSATTLPEEQPAPEHSTPAMYDGVTQRVSPYTQMDDPYASQPVSAHTTPQPSATGTTHVSRATAAGAQPSEESPRALQQMPLAREVLSIADTRSEFGVRSQTEPPADEESAAGVEPVAVAEDGGRAAQVWGCAWAALLHDHQCHARRCTSCLATRHIRGACRQLRRCHRRKSVAQAEWRYSLHRARAQRRRLADRHSPR